MTSCILASPTFPAPYHVRLIVVFHGPIFLRSGDAGRRKDSADRS